MKLNIIIYNYIYNIKIILYYVILINIIINYN